MYKRARYPSHSHSRRFLTRAPSCARGEGGLRGLGQREKVGKKKTQGRKESSRQRAGTRPGRFGGGRIKFLRASKSRSKVDQDEDEMVWGEGGVRNSGLRREEDKKPETKSWR